MGVVVFEQSGALGLITVDFAPVNALSHSVRSGLLDALQQALAAPEVSVIVLRAAGRTFMAGADISEFGAPLQAPNLPEVVNAFENANKPVVAALHGTVLGGGLELALGCHFRIALNSTQLGLPEIKLGLIPGAGGTQRLPRAIGAAAALEAIVSGASMSAARALEAGLLDRVVDTDLATAASVFAHELAANRSAPRRLSEVVPNAAASDLFEQARAALGRHPSGTVAPLAAIAAVEAALTLPFVQGLAREAELFVACYQSPAAKALWHVFFAERKAARIPDITADIAVKKINNVVVIGAGTMGRGIAMSCLNAGLSVTLIDSDPESLKRGVNDIEATYAGAVKRGKLSEPEQQQRRAKLHPALDDESLATADLVIEAVFESMAIKRQVFARLDQRCAPGTILASNTSTLDLNQIAAATSRPQDVVGLHFFSPAHVMRLLEIVRGEHSSREVIASAFAFAKRIGKVAVQARVCFGFIGNRMIEAYLEEALALLLEGATPSQVDQALERFGMAMGPFTMADLAGLDVGYRIRRERTLSQEQQRLFRLPDALVELGRLGQKTQSGFYLYPPGGRKPQPDEAVGQLIARIANELAITPCTHSDEEIVERCLLRLINEGADILSEGIALRAGDIDTVYVNGYGFPAHRGGPMFVASSQGFAHTVARLEALQQRFGPRFRPAEWLRTAAQSSDPVT